MNIDSLNMLYVLLIASSLLSAFTFLIYKYKRVVKAVSEGILKFTYSGVLNYFKRLSVKDFTAYEKYDIWRYCELF